MKNKSYRKFSVSPSDLDCFGIDIKDYEMARLQFVLEELSKSRRHVNETQSYWQMVIENFGIYYDFVVKQRKCLPEPNDAVLHLKITDSGELKKLESWEL